MNTSTEIYNAFDSLKGVHSRLEQRFKSFFEESADLWDEAPKARYNLLDTKLTSAFDGNQFEITVCGRLLRFAFLIGLTEDGLPRGVINCSTPDERFPGSRALVCAIIFQRTGAVDYPPKPADLHDPLAIDDRVSAFYIVSYCMAKVLQIKATTT